MSLPTPKNPGSLEFFDFFESFYYVGCHLRVSCCLRARLIQGGALDSNSDNGCDYEVACMEHLLRRGEGSLHRDSYLVDGFVPPVFFN